MRYVITYEIYVKTYFENFNISCGLFSGNLLMSVFPVNHRPQNHCQQAVERQQYGHCTQYYPENGIQVEEIQRRACLQQLIRHQPYDFLHCVTGNIRQKGGKEN